MSRRIWFKLFFIFTFLLCLFFVTSFLEALVIIRGMSATTMKTGDKFSLSRILGGLFFLFSPLALLGFCL